MIAQLYDDQQPALILVLVFPLSLLPSVRTSPTHSPQGRAPPLPSPTQPHIQQRTVAVPDPVVKVLLGLGGVMVDGCEAAGPTLPVAVGWDAIHMAVPGGCCDVVLVRLRRGPGASSGRRVSNIRGAGGGGEEAPTHYTHSSTAQTLGRTSSGKAGEGGGEGALLLASWKHRRRIMRQHQCGDSVSPTQASH